MDERSSTDLFLNYSGRELYRSSYSGPQEILKIRGRGASRYPKPFEGEGFASIPPKSGWGGGQHLPFCPSCNHSSDGPVYNYSASQSQAWLTPLSAFLVSMETFCISTGQKLKWHKIYCNFLLGRQVLVQSFHSFCKIYCYKSWLNVLCLFVLSFCCVKQDILINKLSFHFNQLDAYCVCFCNVSCPARKESVGQLTK